MHRPFTMALEGVLRMRCSLRYSERAELAWSHFGPGGLLEAEKRCEEANADLLGFVRPDEQIRLEGFQRHDELASRHALRVESFSFRSPRATGCPYNDRVPCRLYMPTESESPGSVVVFHHAMRQDSWGFWEKFNRALVARVPVAIMAAPHHFERKRPGEFAGQRTCSANPWELFVAVRQWCWDHQALRQALLEHFGLRTSAVVGFSLGAFQSLLLAAAGRIEVPIVAMAPTSRYAYGVQHGWLGGNIMRQLSLVGIDYERLQELTRSLQLHLYGDRIDGERVLFIEGCYDRVDPPPSIPLLRDSLRPRRTIALPCGHGSLVLWRSHVAREVDHFFETLGVLPAADEGSTLPLTSETT